jgi:serine/threonine-protein kinase
LVDGGAASVGGATIEGTPYYMAPEQLQGQPVDARADQFGWGVVAFELLSGQLPWDATGSIMAQIAAMLGQPARSLAAADAAVPPGVSAAVMRALARSPDERFASMDLVIEALEPFAEGAESSLALRETQPLRVVVVDEAARRASSVPPVPSARASEARLGDTVSSAPDSSAVAARSRVESKPTGGPSPVVVALALVLLAAVAYALVRFL